jgi:phosphatidylserine/phosphatidylglycerophosphate/cardiolipin synthase-like enzyme
MASSVSPPRSQSPPSPLVNRKAHVGTRGVNTLRVPTSSPRDDSSQWFTAPPGDVTRQGNPMQPIQTGNEVKYLIDGQETFDEMTDAMDTATRPGHFIYLSNWFVNDDFELRNDVPPAGPGQCNSCLHLKLAQAAASNVMVRAMFWDQGPNLLSGQNTKEVNDVNALSTGAAVLDGRGNEPLPIPIVGILPMHFGSQHQKILCVFGDQGLIAFCGGIDFNPDRILRVPSAQKGSPMHDVHCRIRGPAAFDLLKVFTDRWNDHPVGKQHNQNPRKGPLIVPPRSAAPVGSQTVQIGRTFGDLGTILGTVPYGFAPRGELTAREVLIRAITNAKRFIYTEDQYFIGNPELEQALTTALARSSFQHLTILIPHFNISDLPLVHQHRRTFIQNLRQVARDKVRVFFLRGPAPQPAFDAGLDPHTYIHAKLWIVDDEFASIGSVNSGRRSWTHDSEVTAGIYDTGSSTVLKYRLAHKLRIELWQEHLGMQSPQGAAELSDGVASAVHWLSPPPFARVRPYDINEPGDKHLPIPLLSLPLELAFFDAVMDPA